MDAMDGGAGDRNLRVTGARQWAWVALTLTMV
jgi:hypothetical protein